MYCLVAGYDAHSLGALVDRYGGCVAGDHHWQTDFWRDWTESLQSGHSGAGGIFDNAMNCSVLLLIMVIIRNENCWIRLSDVAFFKLFR